MIDIYNNNNALYIVSLIFSNKDEKRKLSNYHVYILVPHILHELIGIIGEKE